MLYDLLVVILVVLVSYHARVGSLVRELATISALLKHMLITLGLSLIFRQISLDRDLMGVDCLEVLRCWGRQHALSELLLLWRVANLLW